MEVWKHPSGIPTINMVHGQRRVAITMTIMNTTMEVGLIGKVVITMVMMVMMDMVDTPSVWINKSLSTAFS